MDKKTLGQVINSVPNSSLTDVIGPKWEAEIVDRILAAIESESIADKDSAPVINPGQQYWWCPECKEEVPCARVTNSEFHDVCGHPVIGKTTVADIAEEPLAVLADRKGYWLEIRNFNKEYGWGIYIKCSVPRGPFQVQELEKDLLTDKNYYDYAAAEAKARAYLNGLPDKE